MALQQYKFFPTDFFYPRPPQTLETSSTDPNAKVVPLQTQKGENQIQNKKQQQPRSLIRVPLPLHALVCTHKWYWQCSPIEKKLSKLSTKPLSYWLVPLEAEEGHAL